MLRKVHVFKKNLQHNKNHSYPLVITYKQYWGGDETPTGSPIKPWLLPQHHLNVRGQPVITLNYNKNLDTAKPVFSNRHYGRGNCNGKDRISDNTCKNLMMEISIELHIERECKSVGLDRFYCTSLDPISFWRKIKMEYCFIYRIRSTMQCTQIDQRTAKENR